MPISSALAKRLSSDPAHAPARRWSPYARPAPHRSRGGTGNNPATMKLLGLARKVAPPGSGGRSEVAEAEPVAPAAATDPAQRRLGCEMSNQKPIPMPNPEERDDKPPADEKPLRGSFVFFCSLGGHTEGISGISLPQGSHKLYSGSTDGSVRVWDCHTGKCVEIIKMGGKIGCMITHGPWVFIGIPKSVEAWNTQTGMKLNLQGPRRLVCSMTIRTDMLFAGTGDGRIMAWNFPSNENTISVEPVAILSGHERPVISLSISAANLFSASLDKTIKVWDLAALQCIQTLSEHRAAVTSVLCWDQKLLSCSLDKTVKVWTLSESGTFQVQHTHSEEHGVRTLFGMYHRGNTQALHTYLFCALHNSNCVLQFNLPSFSPMGTLFSNNEVRTIELSDVWLFTGDNAGELKVWRLAPQDMEEASTARLRSLQCSTIEQPLYMP